VSARPPRRRGIPRATCKECVADFGVDVAGSPAFVFQPVAGTVNATLRVTNIGASPLYAAPLDTLLTPGSYPVPIPVGGHLYVNPVTAATYLSAGFKAGTSTTTLTATAVGAGSTNFTVGSNASFPAGTLMLLGSVTSSQEVLVVASTSSTTVITSTTASLYDHLGSSTVSTATAVTGQARVLTGVI
jgi:hypothetical protein